MLITEISSALSGISHAVKMLKSINDTVKESEINRVIIEMQEGIIGIQQKVLSLQSEYEALAKSKSDIEKQLVEERKRNKDWEQYKLVSLGKGFAYRYLGDTETPHNLCATCSEDGFKSILRFASLYNSRYRTVFYLLLFAFVPHL